MRSKVVPVGNHDPRRRWRKDMYHFAIIVLLGLALFKLVDLVEDLAPRLVGRHTLITFTLAVAGVYAIDWSLFDAWGVPLREDWMSTLLTGLVVFASTSVWRAMLHWLGSTEGDAPEARHPFGDRSRVAA